MGLGQRFDRQQVAQHADQQADEPVDAEEMSQRVTRSILRKKRENSVGERVVELLGEGFEIEEEPTDENLPTSTVENTPASAPSVEDIPTVSPMDSAPSWLQSEGSAIPSPNSQGGWERRVVG